MLTVDHLNVWFGHHPDRVDAVQDASFSVAQGESFGLVGESGSGKSTILRAIAGLIDTWSGTITVAGQPLAARKRDRAFYKTVQMVFQDPYASLHPRHSVDAVLSETLRLQGMDDIDRRIGRLLDDVGLGRGFRFRYPHQLSGGQRQRVAIGRAIVRDPKVYLFDEPLSNLDAALRVATRIEIAQLKAAMPDRTMIYVTHDQTEAMTLADRIVVLAGGGIAQVGAPLELYERPVNEFVAQFIGSPAMNLLPGRVTGIGPVTTVELAGGGSAQVAIPTRPGDEGMRVNLGVRPEDMRETDGPAIFEGTVDLTEALGEVTLLYFGTRGEKAPVIAKLPGIHPGLDGRSVRLTADPAALHLFHDGQSLLYRAGVDLPPYQPRVAGQAARLPA